MAYSDISMFEPFDAPVDQEEPSSHHGYLLGLARLARWAGILLLSVVGLVWVALVFLVFVDGIWLFLPTDSTLFVAVFLLLIFLIAQLVVGLKCLQFHAAVRRYIETGQQASLLAGLKYLRLLLLGGLVSVCISLIAWLLMIL